MPNITCPYCDRAVYVDHPADGRTGWLVGTGDGKYVGIECCPACNGVITMAFPQHGIDTALAISPTSTPSEPDPLIPPPIRADLFEARKCVTVQAWKASAAMCRRALQGACLDKGANPKKRLVDQIDELIDTAKVHSSLKEWADAIRLVGNAGAHPGDDGLETVSEEEARDLLEFTEQFLDLTYVVAERVRRRVAEKRVGG